jgi:hypothetical protein
MSEPRAEYITTTQPIGTITHDLPRPVPTLRQYLQERERHMLRELQRVRDLLAQLPKE